MAWNKTMTQSLFKRVLYYGHEKVLIHADGKIEKTSSENFGKPRLIVLGKKHYFETERVFSFSNLKDIVSAIKTDMTAFSPYGSDLFFLRKINQTKENTRVNLWFLGEGVSTWLKRISPLFIIPETALFAWLNRQRPAIYTVHIRDDEILYAHIDKAGGVKSLCGYEERFDLQWFVRSIGGMSRESTVIDLGPTDDYLPLIPQALSEMPLKALWRFSNVDSLSLNLNQKGLRSGLFVAVILFFLYTMTSSLLIYHTEKRLRQDNMALSEALSELLDKKEEADANYQRQRLLAKNINQYTGKIQIINLLNQILPEEASLTNLTVSGEVVEMRGKAPKASLLLNALTQDPRVKSARFISPLREDKKSGKETFHLSFAFEQGE